MPQVGRGTKDSPGSSRTGAGLGDGSCTIYQWFEKSFVGRQLWLPQHQVKKAILFQSNIACESAIPLLNVERVAKPKLRIGTEIGNASGVETERRIWIRIRSATGFEIKNSTGSRIENGN
ncbi:hypothetical protein EVAR_84807_1 [Eumeta japonica]|uniref:Uncharacterized protein n=1 Tax=Eumeta variegata TaxID=151549 RepID=A0A4C1U8X5_EUMVA|nr:hypothetical protein EVAR_84807_1 [Eumeta japonica]